MLHDRATNKSFGCRIIQWLREEDNSSVHMQSDEVMVRLARKKRSNSSSFDLMPSICTSPSAETKVNYLSISPVWRIGTPSCHWIAFKRLTSLLYVEMTGAATTS
jgi:hypothetical protein